MGRWFGALRWRLLAAFLTVAVGAVALLAVVAAGSVDRHAARLAAAQRAQLRSEVATALAAAYTAGRGSWQPEALAGAEALAASQGAQMQVRDRTGHEVTSGHAAEHAPAATPTPATRPSSSAPANRHGPAAGDHSGDRQPSPEPAGYAPPTSGHDPTGADADRDAGHALGVTARTEVVLAAGIGLAAAPAAGSEQVTVPVVVDGQQVGTARLTFPSAMSSALAETRAALLRAVWIGAALAALLATVAAVFVSRRMTRPVVALTAATRAFAAGDPDADRLVRPGPGELGEVGRAFTAMAASVRRQDELRRTVVADVAHELRTPVTILRGQTEQLLDGIAEPTPARLVSLHDEVLRLQRLTDDLATLSAADAAGLALHLEPIDLAALARQAVEAMQASFDDAELHTSVDAGTAVIVDADPARLTQVITNLLTNAAKFTPPGGTVTVTVRTEGPDALVEVADTGPGIPAEELPHLFERFWRGRAAGSRAGTGIGLAVVHALVSAHGGTVTADSRATTGGTGGSASLGGPGTGARFTLRLPVTDKAMTRPARAVRP